MFVRRRSQYRRYERYVKAYPDSTPSGNRQYDDETMWLKFCLLFALLSPSPGRDKK